MNRIYLIVSHLPAPTLLTATPLFAFAPGNSLTSQHSFTADLVLILGDTGENSGMEATSRSLQGEAVFDADEISLPLPEFIEQIAQALRR